MCRGAFAELRRQKRSMGLEELHLLLENRVVTIPYYFKSLL